MGLLKIKTKEEEANTSSQELCVPKEKQEATSKEEKEKKEREWKDLSEEVKFVCHGGKIQCKYCNPPVAEILPTSTQVMLQDKPYVTIGDTNGIVNFNFTGVCMHPSQQKPFCPPPPCKFVINLGEWKDYSNTMIDNYNAILVKSKIPCMISGEDLEIAHSGQIAELREVVPKMKREPQIIESYWINGDGNRIEKIEPNKKASLVIVTKDYRMKDEITVKLPVDDEEKTYVTYANSKGFAILKDIYMYKLVSVKKEPRIIEAYWRNGNGEKIDNIFSDEKAELFIRTEGYDTILQEEKKVTITLQKEKKDETFANGKNTLELEVGINTEGIAIIKDFKKWM